MATSVDPVKNESKEEVATKSKVTRETKDVSNGVDIKKLLDAGAHFGHKASRWHPNMAPHIHSKKNGSHIIDLTHTVAGLEEALEFLTKTASEGKQVLLVGTKRQAQELVQKTAESTGMPFVVNRWLGGMLTNTNTINKRIKYLKDLETKMATGELANKYSKLEVQRFQEEIDHLNYMYGGIKEIAAKPGAIFVVDVINELNAIREAKKLGIKVVALVDTNADPKLVDFPVPCNDDATKTISLILDYVTQAIEAGKAKVKQPVDTEKVVEKE